MLSMKPFAKGSDHYQELVLKRLQQVIQEAVSCGVVAEINLVPRSPLSTGSYDMVPSVRPSRSVYMMDDS